jgi:hypothetical protein
MHVLMPERQLSQIVQSQKAAKVGVSFLFCFVLFCFVLESALFGNPVH